MTDSERAGGAIDVITFEVIRAAFYATAREMKIAMMRTAASPIIHSGGDASAAMFDGIPRMIAQGNDIPTMLGSMLMSVKETLKAIGVQNLQPGDVIISNDAHLAGGNHNGDVQLVRPVFWEGRIVAFTVTRGHWMDIGGYCPGSFTAATLDIFGEGLRIPALKLYQRDELDPNVAALICANSREPYNREMDIRAQYAGCTVGERRIIELIKKYGIEQVEGCMEESLNYSERRTRDEIRKIPDGTYLAEDFIEPVSAPGWASDPIRVKVSVTVQGDEMTYDFTGSDPQVVGGVNCPLSVTANTCWYVTKVLTDPSIPINEGCYRPIHIQIPPGTVLSAQEPAACVTGNTETSHRLCDTLLAALAPALPERAMAGSSGTAGSVFIGGIDPSGPRCEELGRQYVIVGGVHGGGMGARFDQDGISAIRVHIGNTGNQPVEIQESVAPIVIEGCEIVPDSGGAGRWRGGCAARVTYRILYQQAYATFAAERAVLAGFGLAGGRPGQVAHFAVERAGVWEDCGSKTSPIGLSEGDRLIVQPAGGGGRGDPLAREPERVAADVMDGYISPETARTQYAVAIDPGTGTPDPVGTARLRQGNGRAQGSSMIDWGPVHGALAEDRQS